jgi:hypothetical protein
MRQKIKVAINQRVKRGTKWGRKRIAIPPLKKDGTLFLKDDQQGIFQLCWHENRQKQSPTLVAAFLDQTGSARFEEAICALRKLRPEIAPSPHLILSITSEFV